MSVATRRRFALSFLLLGFFCCAEWLYLDRAPAAAASSFWQRDQDETKRDAWQRPEEVMDALGIVPGSAVADIGCGEGYFVVRLARRVGPTGAVYAVDVDESALKKVRQRAEHEKLGQVRVIQSVPNDPSLPGPARDAGLEAVLIVNAYHEMKEYDSMLRAVYAALKAGGRLAIIDAIGDDAASRARLQDEHESSEKMVREDAARAGFRFRSKEAGFERPESSRRHWFFLIFEK